MGPTATHLGSDSDSTDPSLPACLLPSLPKYFLSTCCVQTVDSTPGPGDDQLESFPALEGSASIEAALFSDEPHTRNHCTRAVGSEGQAQACPGRPPGGDPGETEEEVIWGDPLGGKGPAKSAWLAPSPQTLYCLSSLTSFPTHIPTDKNRLCDCLFTDTCPSSPPPRRCCEGTDNASLVFPLETSPVNL